jgi:hypothetical protein
VHLVEILLPITDNEGQRFDARKYEEIGHDLSRRFGGITTFTRAPARGTSEARGEIVHDDIVVFEVMTDTARVGKPTRGNGGEARRAVLSPQSHA